MKLDNIGKDKVDKTKYDFTNDQQEAIDGIIDFIAKPFNPAKYIVGLTGAGGTGKTFITNYIINNCVYSNSVIKCTSTTHKACRVFSQAIGFRTVETIQSVLGLRLDLKLEDFNPDNPQFNPMGSPKLEYIKLLIVDESSMLPAKLVNYIRKICKDNSIKILFIGDNYQLAPPNENKSIAFDICYKVYNLEEIVRQKLNNPIIDLISLLRKDIKNKTNEFINYIATHVGTNNYNEVGEGFTICNKETFNSLINMSFNDVEYTKNIDMYRIIAYTNAKVAYWNNYVRNRIIKDSDKGIINKNDLVMSYDTIVDDFMNVIIANSEEYIINDIVDFVDDKYGLKGFLVKFQMVHGGNITKPIFIIDHNEKYNILKYHKIIEELINDAKRANGGTRVSKWKKYYDFKKKYLIATNVLDTRGNIIHSRNIDYGFALTSHKSQGSTYGVVFVDANDMIFNKNNIVYSDYEDMLRRLYVGCSRASNSLIICYG